MVRLRARPVGGMRNDPCVIPFRLEVTCCRGLCLWWVEIYPPSSVAYATNCLQFSSPRGEAFCKISFVLHSKVMRANREDNPRFKIIFAMFARRKEGFPSGGKLARKRLMRWKRSSLILFNNEIRIRHLIRAAQSAAHRLAAARSRHGSDSPPDCHSLPCRHYATLKGKADKCQQKSYL